MAIHNSDTAPDEEVQKQVADGGIVSQLQLYEVCLFLCRFSNTAFVKRFPQFMRESRCICGLEFHEITSYQLTPICDIEKLRWEF